MIYWRPLVQSGAARPKGALPLAGGCLWFTHVERLERRLEDVDARQGSLENRFAEGDEDLQRVRTLLKNGNVE